jgi:hypothetical protein
VDAEVRASAPLMLTVELRGSVSRVRAALEISA